MCVYALCLNSTVCPMFLIKLFSISFLGEGSLFCVHMLMGVWVQQLETDHRLNSLCVCGAVTDQAWVCEWVCVWSLAKIKSDQLLKWHQSKEMRGFLRASSRSESFYASPRMRALGRQGGVGYWPHWQVPATEQTGTRGRLLQRVTASHVAGGIHLVHIHIYSH